MIIITMTSIARIANDSIAKHPAAAWHHNKASYRCHRYYPLARSLSLQGWKNAGQENDVEFDGL